MPKTEELLVNNKQMFILAIREGLGFTYACEVSVNDPKLVTEIMQKDKAFHDDCLKATLGAALDFLKASSKFTEEQQFDKALQAKENAKKFGKLILWESYCKKDALTPMMMAKALVFCQEPKEAATSVGLTYEEYIDFVAKDPAVLDLAKRINNGSNKNR